METKFQKIKSIRAIKNETKLWCVVEFENGTKWMPALVDVGAICSCIGYCEDVKYPPPLKGHKLTQEFVHKSFGKKSKKEVAELYNNSFNPNKLPFSQ